MLKLFIILDDFYSDEKWLLHFSLFLFPAIHWISLLKYSFHWTKAGGGERLKRVIKDAFECDCTCLLEILFLDQSN